MIAVRLRRPRLPPRPRPTRVPRPAKARVPRPAKVRPVPRPGEFMAGYRRYALRLVALIVAAATAVAFAESYRALFEWAGHHGVPGVWAAVFPLQIDVFIAVGELALFVALVDGWALRHRAWAWLVTFGGLAVSVGGNVGHIGPAPWADRLTASVPPVAAFTALTVALGVLKRVAERAAAVSAPAPVVDLADVGRRAVLAAAETDAARIRYAITEGCPAAIGAVRDWLAYYGHDVAEVNVMSVLRRGSGTGNGSAPATATAP